MNMNATELAAFAVGIGGVPVNAGIRASITAQLQSVILLERTGDAVNDPYRTCWGYFDSGRATTAANAVKSTAQGSCVLLYNGSALSGVVSGDPSLLQMYMAKSGRSSAAPTPQEVEDVAVTASALGPASTPSAPIQNSAVGSNTTTVDPDPNAVIPPGG